MKNSSHTALAVELRAARIPGVIGIVADHFWFVLIDEAEGRRDRWEIWQKADVAGQSFCQSWGHLHKNLMAPERGVGGDQPEARSPSRLVTTWYGQEASTLMERIKSSVAYYPFCYRYAYWPGPNSNTFAQWVLNSIGYRLAPTAIGKDYCGLHHFHYCRDTKTLVWMTPLIGFRVRPHIRIEIQLLGLTFGYDQSEAAFLLPIRRMD